MINTIKTPKEGAVFLTENPLKIEVSSTLGAEHYFKVFIKVNGEQFDIQGWSKYNDTNCIIDLQRVFSDIFDCPFSEVSSTGLKRVNELMKLVEVTVKEYKRVDEQEVNNLTLPSFYVINSAKELSFDHTKNLQKLSVLPDRLRVSSLGVLNLPLWLTAKLITVSIYDGNDLIFEEIYNDLQKGMFVFSLFLKQFNLKSDLIEIRFNSENESLSQYLKLEKLNMYSLTKIYAKNNFGIFEYLELFGSLKGTVNYTRKNYTLQNKTEFIADTTTRRIHKINTGFLFQEELSLVDLINEATVVFVEKNGKFVSCIPIGKKAKGFNTDSYYQDDVIELQENYTPIHNESLNYD